MASGISSPATELRQCSDDGQGSAVGKRKIPIGVFDAVYDKLTLDQMLDKVSRWDWKQSKSVRVDIRVNRIVPSMN